MPVARSTVGVLLVFASAAAPAGAFHESGLPVLASGGPSARGWVSFTVRSDGAPFGLDIDAPALYGPFQQGVAFYTETGAFDGAGTYTGEPGRVGTLVEVHAGPVDYRYEAFEPDAYAGGPLQARVRFEGFVGTVSFVAWWAGNASWTWSLGAAPGATLLGSDAGERAYLFTAEDFRSATHIMAFTPYGARAQVLGELPLDVHDTFIGGFFDGLASVDSLSVQTPEGERRCPSQILGSLDAVGVPLNASCDFYELGEPEALGPGAYAFRATGAGAGFSGTADVYLGGADIRLPA